MDADRERALTLAHQETLSGTCIPAEDVVARARVYLDFLKGTQGDKNAEPMLRVEDGVVWHSWNGGKGWWNGEPNEITRSIYRSHPVL